MTYNIREQEEKLIYPQQQHFDHETLAPLNDVTRNRIENLLTHAPELFETGGESFLDIGCAKGLLCHILADVYPSVVGYEPDAELFRLALAIAASRGKHNVIIKHGDHRSIPLSKWIKNTDEEDKSYQEQLQYTTVFVGDVHHYFVKAGYLAGAPWLWIEKLKSLAKKYIIIDGPVFACDFAVQRLAEEHAWPADLLNSYTPVIFYSRMAPQFALVRCVENERHRHTLVFKRVADDCESVVLTPEDVERIKSQGTDIPCDHRPPKSVVKMGNMRYKFDRGALTAGVLNILQHTSYFPKTRNILHDTEGNVIGEVRQWLDGKHPRQFLELLPDWLKMNTALSSVGLFEPAYILKDYVKPAGSTNFVNIDCNMVNNFHDFHTMDNKEYADHWKESMGKMFSQELYARQDYLFDRF